jgi:guanylate kinase
VSPLPSDDAPRVVLLAGAHGSGKDSIAHALAAEATGFTRVVRHITRAPAADERDGYDYHFIDVARFDLMESSGLFAESSRHHDSRSGTCWTEFASGPTISVVTCNFDDGLILFERIRRRGWMCRLFFVSPVERNELESEHFLDQLRARLALRGRATDAINVRVSDAASYRSLYLASPTRAHFIVNREGDLARALAEVRRALAEEGGRWR